MVDYYYEKEKMSEKDKKYVPGCFVNGVEHSPETLGDGGESPTPQDISVNDSSFSLGGSALTSVEPPTNLNLTLGHGQKLLTGSRTNTNRFELFARLTAVLARKVSNAHKN